MRKQAKFFLIAFLIIILLSTISLSIPTIIVEETDLVEVEIDTFDPDNDDVTIIYSAPLNKEGRWQTDYGDAGNYTTVVTATDGKSLTEEEFLIIVKKKNQAPEIKVQDHIEAEETDTIKLRAKISDPNNDKIKIEISPPFDKEDEWKTTYEDAGEYVVTIKASDGELESTRLVKITIYDKNRPPEFVAQPQDEDVEINENENLYFSVNATDEDGDEAVYLWELDGEIVAWETSYSYSTDYESAGSHILKLVVSDGIDEVVKEWQIEVFDVNRPPHLPEFDEVFVKEGQTLRIDLPLVDEDGDELIYFIEEPFDEDLEWEVSYEDAGEYELAVRVTDGEFTDEGELYVFVEDIDRAPEFEEISRLEINETDELLINLDASDPDGDDIYYYASGFPEGAILSDDEIFWQPDHDFVAKPDSFMVRLMSRLRLDKYLWQKKDLEAVVMACGKDLCTNQTINVQVNDINRIPEMWLAEEVVINETDKLKVKPAAADLDGDVVKFYFTEPLDRSGKWQTNYDDEGEYWVTVGATDGRISTEKVIKIIVNNVNRQPTLDDIQDRHVNEGEEVWIKVDTQDPDSDELDLWVESAPEDSSFRDQWFSWTPGHDVVSERKGKLHDLISNFGWLNRRFSQEKQYFGVNFVVSDGDFIISKLVDIAVRNWNQPPEIINSTPENLQTWVGEPVLFAVDAVDLDGDVLEYDWNFGFTKGGIKNTNAISRRFTSPGEKKIVLTISDGRDSVEKEWKVLVGQKAVEEVPVQPAVQPTFATYVV